MGELVHRRSFSGHLCPAQLACSVLVSVPQASARSYCPRRGQEKGELFQVDITAKCHTEVRRPCPAVRGNCSLAVEDAVMLILPSSSSAHISLQAAGPRASVPTLLPGAMAPVCAGEGELPQLRSA